MSTTDIDVPSEVINYGSGRGVNTKIAEGVDANAPGTDYGDGFQEGHIPIVDDSSRNDGTIVKILIDTGSRIEVKDC